MTRGIIYIAFGPDYTRLAMQTIAHSRKYTDLPIAVITNMPSNFAEWDKLGVKDIFVDRAINENRDIKTTINQYSPFARSLYMDADAVIQRKGIESVFEIMGDADMLLQRHGTWRAGKPYFKIYKEAMVRAGALLPINIYIGGFFCFRKNKRTALLFSKWNEGWKLNGSGRDMPALACAVQNSPELKIRSITQREDKIFSFGIDPGCIAVHRSRGDDLEKAFGIPRHKQFKPFDKKDNNDWQLVNF